jgi:hypothetical protein
MRQRKFTLKIVGLICFMIIGLHCSGVYSGETTPPPPGTVLPKFTLKGPGAPDTKTKLVLVEFFDVF